MKKLVDLVKVAYLDSLIRRKNTGSPNELAKKLGMSRSNLFYLISFLRDDMQAPIVYSKERISYYYEYNPKFYLGFERDRLNTLEMKTIWAGGENKDENSLNNTKDIDEDV